MDNLTQIVSLLISVATLFSIIWNIIQTTRQKSTIDLLEKNTNSIKDALVASTERAAGLAGEKRGREGTELESKGVQT